MLTQVRGTGPPRLDTLADVCRGKSHSCPGALKTSIEYMSKYLKAILGSSFIAWAGIGVVRLAARTL
jgi:hypothetical protein